jgi:preprotein translocase subunit SecE
VAHTENAPNKPVHLMFLIGAIVTFYLTKWMVDWIWGYFVTTPEEFTLTVAAGIFAILLAIILYKNDRIFTLANEVASELAKVTWPTAKEVRAAAIVVILVSVVVAMITGLFDFMWSNLTEMVYG